VQPDCSRIVILYSHHKYAPLALFVYNRLEHTRRTVEALIANDMASATPLYIFSDAARDSTVLADVQRVRMFVRGLEGFASVTVIERERNLGLADSIIDGVSMLCERFGCVIVLEDDLVTSRHFLRYMNDALKVHAGNERVASVSAYMYPVRIPPGTPDTVLLQHPMSWGWATWDRAWKLFDADGRRLLSRLEEHGLLNSFGRVGPGGFVKMLRGQINGQNNSWFIRWHASLYLCGRLTLAPTRSLINNIGLDGTGVHCSRWLINPYQVVPSQAPIHVELPAPPLTACFGAALSRFFFWSRILRYVNAVYRLLVMIFLRFGRRRM
jgi:hypothetical protein